MLRIAEMVIHLAFESALDHHLGEPAQQPALAGELQPAGPRPLGELPKQLLVGRRQLGIRLVAVPCYVSHLVSPPVSEVTPLKLQSLTFWLPGGLCARWWRVRVLGPGLCCFRACWR